ncbi:hypothetical protein, partial [Parabacteroides sp. 52]|uniref:hypothetical protein n=1 Tax=Parabacteroides sp. 52 TaxID=2302940 RepID=UPI001943AD32
KIGIYIYKEFKLPHHCKQRSPPSSPRRGAEIVSVGVLGIWYIFYGSDEVNMLHGITKWIN